MMKYITEQIYYITYINKVSIYENHDAYLASSIEEAIAMCKEENPNCWITEVRTGSKVKRKSTKNNNS